MTGGAFGNLGSLPALPVEGGVSVSGPREGAFMSGFDAAASNPLRGEIFYPTLDTREELDSWSREKIIEGSRWAYQNTGLVGGMVDNAADLIGAVRLGALNEDPEYVLRANEVIESRMGTPEIFDVAGQFDATDCQPMLNRCRFRDGDTLIVNVNGADGGAQFAFYEAHQICDPPNSSSSWRDGVRYDARGRKVAYGVRDGESGKVKVIDAKDIFYYGYLKSPGNGRAIPPLARALTNSLDLTEMKAFLKAALKSSSLFGAVIETAGQNVPDGMKGMGGKATATNPATGEKFEIARVFRPGQIPSLAAGQSLKVVADARPPQEVMAFMHEVVRDIAVGFGLPPEVVWFIIDLTGPGMRFVMDVVDRWVKQQLKGQVRLMKRMGFRVLGCEIDRGRLAISEKDRAWWKLKTVAQRNLTIDRGQVSRARLAEIEAGVGTWESWEEIDETPWMDRHDQWLREIAYGEKTAPEIGKEFGLEGFTLERAFAIRRGKTAGAAAGGAEEDLEQEEEEKGKEGEKKRAGAK